MAMSGSLTISNQTGETLCFTSFGGVNDDAVFTAPPTPYQMAKGAVLQIGFSNSSFFMAPRGVGCSAAFIDGNFCGGGIYLEIPASGVHVFTGNSVPGNARVFQFTLSNPGDGDSYSAVIS